MTAEEPMYLISDTLIKRVMLLIAEDAEPDPDMLCTIEAELRSRKCEPEATTAPVMVRSYDELQAVIGDISKLFNDISYVDKKHHTQHRPIYVSWSEHLPIIKGESEAKKRGSNLHICSICISKQQEPYCDGCYHLKKHDAAVRKEGYEQGAREERERVISAIKQNCIIKSVYIPDCQELVDVFQVTRSFLESLRGEKL